MTLSTTIICILFCLHPLQTIAQQNIYLGLKGGISIPNLSSGSTAQSDWDEGYSSRIGPNLGVLGEFQFSNTFSMQPEIDFIGEGGKRNGIQPFSVPDKYLAAFQAAFKTDRDYVFSDYNNVSRINYLQIPVMAKFNFPLNQNQRLKFFVQAGPFISFLVGAKQLVKTADLKVYQDKAGQQQIPPEAVAAFFGTKLDTAINAKGELHKTNVGVQGAIGLSYNFGPGKLFIEGGGNYGFIDMQKGAEHGKNRIGAATVALGYALSIWER